MNNKNIMFNERRPSQTTTYCMILFIENSRKDKTGKWSPLGSRALPGKGTL